MRGDELANLAWVCALCDETFPATGTGHYNAQMHVREQHPGVSGAVKGLIDTDTGEVVLSGSGPAVLSRAQQMGLVEVTGQRARPSTRKSGGGKADRSSSPIRGGMTYRQVPIKPYVEAWFDMDRTVAHALKWPVDWSHDDGDKEFGLWLHDVIDAWHQEHAELLAAGLGRDESGGAEDKPLGVSREDLMRIIPLLTPAGLDKVYRFCCDNITGAEIVNRVLAMRGAVEDTPPKEGSDSEQAG